MARRKNVKRIDPRYFLNETAKRGEESPQLPKNNSKEVSKPDVTKDRK